MEYQRLNHIFAPVWDEKSKILILGSFPSVKSREEGFYYGNPRNRFWQTLSLALEIPEANTVYEKKQMLLSAGIALWDVVKSCEIKGSSDSSIKSVTPNDLTEILCRADIKKIIANGQTAGRLYKKYSEDKTGVAAVILPSTSPANAKCSLPYLAKRYREEFEGIII